MPSISIKLHQSLWLDNEPHHFSGNYENITLIEAIVDLLKDNPSIKNLCVSDRNKKKPGILYISEKMELSSLGLLDIKLDEDIEIRIVPVLHGG